MRNSGVIVDGTIAFRKKRKEKGKGKGNLSNFWIRERVDLTMDFCCRMIVDLLFYCSFTFKETFSKGKSSPRS